MHIASTRRVFLFAESSIYFSFRSVMTMYSTCHSAENDKADNGKRRRRSLLLVVEGEHIQIGDERVRFIGGRTLGDGEDNREGVENVDDIQHRADRQRRADQRNGHMEQLLPEIRAVYRRRLIIRCVNGLQAGKHAERDKRNGDKDTDAALPRELNLIRRAPVDGIFDDAQIEQDIVQIAVFILDDIVPDGRLNDQRRRPREDNDRAGQFYGRQTSD